MSIPVDASTNFQPTPAHLEAAQADGALKGLIVASPSNPTGTVLSRKELFVLQVFLFCHIVSRRSGFCEGNFGEAQLVDQHCVLSSYSTSEAFVSRDGSNYSSRRFSKSLSVKNEIIQLRRAKGERLTLTVPDQQMKNQDWTHFVGRLNLCFSACVAKLAFVIRPGRSICQVVNF